MTLLWLFAAFFVAKSMTTGPVEIVQIIYFSVIIYFMTGYQAAGGKFVIFMITMILFALTSETVGHLCAICTKSSHNGAPPHRVSSSPSSASS